jgi:hypothetical protein
METQLCAGIPNKSKHFLSFKLILLFGITWFLFDLSKNKKTVVH